MNIKQKIEELKRKILDPKKPIWILLTLLLMASVLIVFQKKDPALKNTLIENSRTSLDTFVPEGFVLVPLDLVNNSSIDALIGSFSMVDLYPINYEGSNSDGKNKVKPIGTHLRLIRSPNNPTLFAVLVPEEDLSIVPQLSSPVFAVVQGPKAKPPTKVEPLPSKRTRAISYGDLL